MGRMAILYFKKVPCTLQENVSNLAPHQLAWKVCRLSQLGVKPLSSGSPQGQDLHLFLVFGVCNACLGQISCAHCRLQSIQELEGGTTAAHVPAVIPEKNLSNSLIPFFSSAGDEVADAPFHCPQNLLSFFIGHRCVCEDRVPHNFPVAHKFLQFFCREAGGIVAEHCTLSTKEWNDLLVHEL